METHNFTAYIFYFSFIYSLFFRGVAGGGGGGEGVGVGGGASEGGKIGPNAHIPCNFLNITEIFYIGQIIKSRK